MVEAARHRLALSDVAARRAAVDELRQMGDLSRENLVLAELALGDEDSLVRQAAAQVLIVQAAERPELSNRLVAWAGMTSDPQCRELLELAAVGKMPGDAAP